MDAVSQREATQFPSNLFKADFFWVFLITDCYLAGDVVDHKAESQWEVSC